MVCGQDSTPQRGICQTGLDPTCRCQPGFSGYDCSISPQVLKIYPEFGPVTGSFSVSMYCLLDPIIQNSSFYASIGGQRSVPIQSVSLLVNKSKQSVLTFTVPDNLDVQCVLSTTSHPSWSACGVSIELSISGRIITNNGVILYLVNYPEVSSVTPDALYYLGGTVLTVTGINFLDNALPQVMFGIFPATTTTYRNSMQLLVVSPPCHPTCMLGSGTSVGISFNSINFQTVVGLQARFFGDIQIESLAPDSGSILGGTPVILYGTNLTVGNSILCKFGFISVPGMLETELNAVKCIAPSAENEGLVSLSIALDGQSFSMPSNCSLQPTKCFLYVNPVVVAAITPSMGPIGGFTKLIISGFNFYNSTKNKPLCIFKSVPVQMQFISANQYSCFSPVTDEEILTAFAISANGIDVVNTSFSFQFYRNPQISAQTGATFLPIGAPLAGGTFVTISGSGFRRSGNGIRVSFISTLDGGQMVYSDRVSYVSENVLVILTPRTVQSSDTYVTVSLNGGQQYCNPSIESFTFYSQPVLSELIPNLGPRLGETSVIIVGSGFLDMGGSSKCLFGQQIVPAFYDASNAGQSPVLICVTPALLTVSWVQVEISLDGQSFTKASPTKFDYYGEYDIVSVAPNAGPVKGGTNVTIAGIGFIMSEYLTCFFGTGLASCETSNQYPCYISSAAIFLSTSTVTCASPPIPGAGDVTIEYPVGLALNGQFSQACPNSDPTYFCTQKATLMFSYYKSIYISRIVPNSGSVNGGTPITVTGSNFQADRFSVTACLFTLCKPNEVTLSGYTYKLLGTSCSGGTVQSTASAIISSTVMICRTPLGSSADSYIAIFDVSLNNGINAEGNYGPVCPDGCPVLFTYYSMPSLASAVPSLGPMSGGTSVTLAGMGFLGSQNTPARCLFGGLEATAGNESAYFLSMSSIVCFSPSQRSPGLVKIQISLNGMDTDFTPSSAGASFLYHLQPLLLDRPLPSAGPSNGQTLITLSGVGFVKGQPVCKFYLSNPVPGQKLCIMPAMCTSSAILQSSSLIVCKTPQVLMSILVSVTVALNGEDFTPLGLSNSFYFFLPPDVSALYPSTGPAESGGSVLVYGSNFPNTGSILCSNGITQSSGVFLSSSLVRCQAEPIQAQVASASLLRLGLIQILSLPPTWVPSPIQSYPLELSFDGQTYTGNKIQYLYYASPQVVSIQPSYASKTDGSLVSILTGYDFRNDLGGPWCRFANTEPVLAIFISGQNILCHVPKIGMGQRVIVDISINGQDYESHKSQLFIFYGQAPVLQSAVFNFQYASIEIRFDVNTDRGGLNGVFECGIILQNPTINISSRSLSNASNDWTKVMYGIGSFCTFLDNQTLVIQLGMQPSIELGQNISLVPNVLMRGNELTYYAAGSISITAGNVVVPQIISSFNSQIGLCDSIVIDAGASTGGAGRPLSFIWSVSNDPKQITDDTYTESQKAEYLSELYDLVRAFSTRNASVSPFQTCAYQQCLTCLKFNMYGACIQRSNSSWTNCDCSNLNVPFKQFPVGNFQFTLTVVNWLGASSKPVTFTVQKVKVLIISMTDFFYS